MAILNFLPGSMIYNQYQDYFKERNTIIFNESFCTGRIPLDIFRDSAKDAYKIRIEEINKTYGVDCSKDYYDFIIVDEALWTSNFKPPTSYLFNNNNSFFENNDNIYGSKLNI